MAAPAHERRRSPRRKPPQLVYLEFGRENGGMVKDVSEGGMRFHLMGPVAAGQSLQFGVTIDAGRRIEGQALMVWTDASGKSGGMAFTELSAQARETLSGWLAEIDGLQQLTGEMRPPTPTRLITPAPVAAPNPLPSSAASPQSNRALEVARQAAPITAPLSPEMAEVISPPPATVQIAEPSQVAAPSQSPALVVAIAALETALKASAESAQKNDIETQYAVPAPEKRSWEIPMALPGRPAAAKSSVAEPVSREEWQEAAREEITPGRRRVPGMKSISSSASGRSATGSAALESAKFAAIAEQVDPAGAFLKPTAIDRNAKHELQGGESAQGPDPLRNFLRQPLAAALDNEASPEAPAEWPDAARSASKSKVAMILVAVAIAAALGFATIVYRQPVGELLIRLGEKLSGESRGAVGSALPGATQTSAANGSQRSQARDVQPDESEGRLRSAQTTKPVAQAALVSSNGITYGARDGASSGPTNGASSSTGGGPITPERPQPPRAPAAQTELAASREIVPGKPRPLSTSLDALWLDVENGNTAAEIELANRYASGEGVQKNCDQARILLQAAAKRGSEAAVKRLSEMPASGCQ